MTISRIGSFGGGVSSGNVAINLPGGISFADAIGAVGITSTSRTLTAPAGWTTRAGYPVDAGNARFYVWTKDDVTASDSGALTTWATDAGNKVCVAGFVLHSSNGFPADWTDDLTFQEIGTTGTVYTAPSSTSTEDDTFGVAFFGARGTQPTPYTPWTPASGLTERQDIGRTGAGATTLQMADSNGSVGPATTAWGPFTESNISSNAGGGLTWLVKENATSGGGGGGGGGGVVYPKLGLWRNWDTDGSWTSRMYANEGIYGPFQGHWSQYYGTGVSDIGTDVSDAFDDGKDIHLFWKPWDTSWANTGSGSYDTEVDAFAADVIAMCSGSGRRIWLTLHHEPENDVNTTGGSGFEVADYRAMWSRVRARFNSAAASQYVTWVCVFMNSHANPSGRFSGPGQGMIDLWGNDGVMDGLVDVVSQQDYIVKGTPASTIATKWLEDLEFLVSNSTANRNWSYLDKPQAFTEWGADLGGAAADRGTDLHRAQTIDAIRGILDDLASRNVVEIRYFDARTDRIVPPPSVDGTAFQALKTATESGQPVGPGVLVGSCNARDTLTATSDTITFDMQDAGISGWQQGDFAVVWLSLNSNPTMSTEPAGWTLQQGPISNSTTQRGWIYYKELVAGEPDPSWVTSQSLRGSGIMAVARGIDTADPFAVVSGLTATSSGTSHAAPAATVPVDDCILLTAWLFRWATSGGTVYGTVPGSHDEVETVSPNSGANPGAGALLGALAGQPVAAGSYGPYTATIGTTSTGLCGQVALRPAPDAPAPVVSGQAAGAWGFTGLCTGGSGVAAEVAGDVVPAVRVLAAFGSDPYSTAPAYTDITAYVVEPFEIGFGAADEFSDVEPATCRFRLKNPDGRFTMGRTDGPYGAGVVPGVRLLVVLDYGGGDVYTDGYGAGFGAAGGAFVRFDGHVNSWPVTWDQSLDVPVGDITATDRMRDLGEVGALRSMLEQETLALGPDIYYPLSEAEGALSVGSVAVERQPAAAIQVWGAGGGLLGFGEGVGPGTDGQSALVCTPNAQVGGRYLVATRARVGSSAAVWLSCFFATTNVPSPNGTVLCALTTQGGESFELNEWLTGAMGLFVIHAGQGVFGNISPKLYNDGDTHHLLGTLTYSAGTTTARLYVDGTLRHTGTFEAGPLPIFTRVDIGANHMGQTAPFNGTISHVAAGSGTLTAGQVQTIYRAGLLGLIGERTDDRMHRVANWSGLPGTERAFDIGDKFMGAQRTDGKTPLDALRDVERVEQGRVFFHGGLFRFHSRSRRYNRPADVTLDVAADEVQIPATYPGDDFGVVNDMEVSRPDGATQRVVDQASIDANRRHADSLEVAAESDNDAQAVANWRVGTYGSPMVRLPSLTVSLSRLHELGKSSLVVALLGLTIGDVIAVDNLPDQAPVSSDAQVVEGWTEVLGTGVWAMVFNCSPHSVNTVWELGVAGRSELGDTTRLAL